MSENQPREYDAVLGGNQAPVDGVVLGGIEGIKRRLQNSDKKHKISAFRNALINYGDAGKELIIQILNDKSPQVKKENYQLLSQNFKPEIQQILLRNIPYDTFECLYHLELYRATLYKFAICSDKKTLVTLSSNDTITVWNLITGKIENSCCCLTPILNANDSVLTAIAVSADNEKCFVGCSDGIILLVDIKANKILKTLRGNSKNITYICTSPDGKFIASGSKEQDIEIWDLITEKIYSSDNKSCDVNFIEISSDSKIAISQSKDNIKIWDLQTKKLLNVLGWDKKVGNCIGSRINPTKKTIVGVNNQNVVQEWNLMNGKLLNRITLDFSYPRNYSFSPDWKTLWGTYPLGIIKIWDWHTAKLLHSLEGYSYQYINSIIFSNNCEFVIMSGNDGKIQVWGLK
ncbi:WD-repeat protein [Calothrix parasitica NIES-267]|uniref:WD-repeat protein n=1 Tax=Calothrix parasitica NIES-267 TaxID=1973488 RepID=A0A1Z4LND0_9CYAN|nr:WD-repeat protein [Calothrix parasitica NIES-267]